MTGLSPRIRGTLLVVLGALIVVFVVPAIAPHSAPLGLLIQGAELGAVNGSTSPMAPWEAWPAPWG
jgi:hypothetical protein